MLTRFLNKSKPVNYLLTVVFMALIFVVHFLISGVWNYTTIEIIKHFFIIILLLFSLLLADFITRKNDLTRKNTFVIFFYATYCTLLPESFFKSDVLISHFFILLALRRIISFKSRKDLQKKIFDAALWISIASCFDFWAFAFIIVLYLNILFEAGSNYRHYFIPFLGFFTVLILTNVLTLYFQNAFYLPIEWAGSAGFDFTAYNNAVILIPLTLVLTLLVWMIGIYFLRIKLMSKKRIRSMRLILVILAVALFVPVVTAHKSGAELIYMALPFAIITTNFIELPEEKYFKELLLWLFLLLPFLLFFL